MSASDDNLETLFPGAQLTHLVTVVADDALAGLRAVLTAVDASGAVLHGVNVAPRGATSVQRVRLGGLAADAARRLAEQIAAAPAVARASVEHHVSRKDV